MKSGMKAAMLFLLLAGMMMAVCVGCGVAKGGPEDRADGQKAVSEAEESAAETGDAADDGTPALKDLVADYFELGVCINPVVISDPAYSALTVKHFSSATCENDMKPENTLDKDASLQDLEGGGRRIAVNMDKCKAELDFARDHGMKMRGHTLIWHSQTPDWIFYVNYDKAGGELADRELMLTRVDNYMADVFTWVDENYPGLFYAWDVVNEAMDDNNTMRQSLWYQTIGPDYVEQVFAIARRHAPEGVKLFYNDYNEYRFDKLEAIIEMLKPVAEAGNLDGFGMQAHLNTGVEQKKFVTCAKRYAEELGVIIHVTEIDVSTPFGTNSEKVQGWYYGGLFRELVNAKKAGVPIESVSIWGLSDNLSWKAEEKPLLWDKDLNPKKGFESIVETMEGM